MALGPIPGIGAVGPGRLRPSEAVWPVDEELEPIARLEKDSYSGGGQAAERELDAEDTREDSTSSGGDQEQKKDDGEGGVSPGGVDLMA